MSIWYNEELNIIFLKCDKLNMYKFTEHSPWCYSVKGQFLIALGAAYIGKIDNG